MGPRAVVTRFLRAAGGASASLGVRKVGWEGRVYGCRKILLYVFVLTVQLVETWKNADGVADDVYVKAVKMANCQSRKIRSGINCY